MRSFYPSTLGVVLGIILANPFGAAQVYAPPCTLDYQITASQAEAAGIDNQTASSLSVALSYERSQWSHGSVEDDNFYDVPKNSSQLPAGSLLKVQVDTNVSQYSLPPNTAISRILFQTKTLNGTLAPASAYILWPYLPRSHPDGFQVVAFAHGNSGGFGECAPSHLKYLLYQFAAPYTLATQGYVVVAPDYQGQGVTKDAGGKPIKTTVGGSPGHANDLFYSVQAAKSAFSSLSKSFVVMGHSEGGGAAWAAAERQAVNPVDGHLGTIAASPLTNVLAIAELYGPIVGNGALPVIPALLGTFPDFKVSDVLTKAGEKVYNLLADIQGCNQVGSVLTFGPDVLLPNWTTSFYAQAYQKLVATGGKAIGGPLLVLQGEADMAVPVVITAKYVNETCTAFPKSKLDFLTFPNVTHAPVLYASQRIWLGWIADRFAGKEVENGCRAREYKSARDYKYYQPDENWFLEPAAVAGD